MLPSAPRERRRCRRPTRLPSGESDAVVPLGRLPDALQSLSAAIEPFERRAPGRRPGNVDERAVRGRGEHAPRVTPKPEPTSVRDGSRAAAQAALARDRSGCAKSLPSPHEEQVAHRIRGVGGILQHEPILLAVDGRIEHRALRSPCSASRGRGNAVRREGRAASDGCVSARGIGLGQRLRGPTRRGDAGEAGVAARRKDDRCRPCSTFRPDLRRSRRRRSRPTRRRASIRLSFVADEKPEGAAVRRPERDSSRPRSPEGAGRRPNRAPGSRAGSDPSRRGC